MYHNAFYHTYTVPPTVEPFDGKDAVAGVKGRDYQLKFTIRRASPPVETKEIVWTYSNVTSGQTDIDIAELDSSRFILDPSRLSLKIADIMFFDDGIFSLTATNPAGVHTASINFTVYG